MKKKIQGPMHLLGHNGLDVETQEDVYEAHRIVELEAEKWGLHQISEPVLLHGTYSFIFRTPTTIAGRSYQTRRAATIGCSSRATRKERATSTGSSSAPA